jgi:hypothetical protein
MGTPNPEEWPYEDVVHPGQDKKFMKSDLERAPVWKPNLKVITDLDLMTDSQGNTFPWSQLILPTLVVDPTKRVSIFGLLQSPLFDSVRDTSLESHYINCLDNLYLRGETDSLSDDGASLFTTAEPILKFSMRNVLGDWLLEVSRVLKLRRESWFMALHLIDIHLPTALPRNELQAFGLACLNVATSYLEVYAPEFNEYVRLSDGNAEGVLLQRHTLSLLESMSYDLVSATPIDFLRESIKFFQGRLTAPQVDFSSDPADLALIYRVSQGILYSSIFMEKLLVYDASQRALWSLYYAVEYWNLIQQEKVGESGQAKSKIDFPFFHLLPTRNIIPLEQAATNFTLPDSVKKYFLSDSNDNLDVQQVLQTLLNVRSLSSHGTSAIFPESPSVTVGSPD